MFVVVRFGEKEEGIFNPNCKCITLLSNIRDRCGENEDEIDVSDETGNLKNLREFPYKYANELLTERERLVLLRVDRKDNGDSSYTPLLNDKEAVNDQFLSQLASKANLGVGSSRRNRSSSSRRTPTKNSSTKKESPDNKNTKAQPQTLSKTSKTGAISRAKSRGK